MEMEYLFEDQYFQFNCFRFWNRFSITFQLSNNEHSLKCSFLRLTIVSEYYKKYSNSNINFVLLTVVDFYNWFDYLQPIRSNNLNSKN